MQALGLVIPNKEFPQLQYIKQVRAHEKDNQYCIYYSCLEGGSGGGP